MEWQEIINKIRLIKEDFDKSYKCLNTDRVSKDETIEKHIQNLITKFEEIRVILNVNYNRLTTAHKVAADAFFLDIREKLSKISTRKGLEIEIPNSLHQQIIRKTSKNSNITHNTSQLTTTMTMNASELASIAKLIPIYSGRKEELNPFIANLELIQETLDDTKKPHFFQFIFKTRLDQKVQNRIKQTRIPNNLEELINELKKNYKTKQTPNSILNDLNKIKQQGDLRKFADKIESLISELNELQISSIGEESRNAIIQSNGIIAFNAFKNGLADRELIKTIEASRVKTFSEALEIAEESNTSNTQAHIMHQRIRSNNRNYNRNNNWNSINRINNHNNRNNNFVNYRNRGNHFNNSRNNTNFNRNNNPNTRNNTFNNRSGNNNNNFNRYRQNNTYRNNNNRHVHTIQDSGNILGSEYSSIPDSQI